MRDVVNSIFYIALSGCEWRMLPKDFPPFTTVQRYFYAWRDNGLWQTINYVLLMDVREEAGREASPTAGVINSQSVKTAESGGPRGYAAEKMIKGRKRHILTDTIGLPVGMIVHPAKIVMARLIYWQACVSNTRGYETFLLMAAAPVKNSWKPSRTGAIGPLRSSSAPTLRKGLSFCHGGEWLNAPSLGSTATAALPKTSKQLSKVLLPGFTLPPSS